ncbi:MAG TPA: prepilin-type N-terminal cleavage/methylation domain-containing protein, partial [Candidatus Methylomirabilis sp.]|nr:prepilin-type N-terminal cleavage/methylation domain-containing protein [Candidatus Methylomirabilis sp.]
MKAPAHFRRAQTGFSITELMVAMTIGLIILAAVAGLFVSTNKASNNQNRLARVQENGRFAMYYLLRDLRMTGYMGCQNDLTDHLSNDLATTTGFYFGTTNLPTPLEGIDDVTSGSTPAWSPSASTTLPTNVWTGTAAAIGKPDLLAIRR